MLRNILSTLALIGVTVSSYSYGKFTLDKIPELTNKQGITLVAEDGFWTEHLKQEMLPLFTAKTGVPVNVVTSSLDNMFQLQTHSLKNGLGKYDLLTMEAGWAKEWASNGFTVPLSELARLYDPDGQQAITNYLAPYYSSLLSILSYRDELHSIPYNNYVMGNHYRYDLFNHPLEKANFLAQFGYPLSPPATIDQLKDTAQFFTRSKGQQLAGKQLEHHFYGVTLMSGNRPHINDEFSSMLWSQNTNWFTPKYNAKKKLTHFELSMQNASAQRVANDYHELKAFAPPSDANYAFLEAAKALNSGQVAMWPFAYNNLWQESIKVEQNVHGAKLAVAQVPGGHPYNGAYAFAVSFDGKNPQAAYWLLKYMGSYDAQYAYAMGGGNPCRKDVVLAETFQQEKYRHIAGAFMASHEANIAWSKKVLNKGHFTSTAMGHIYPELTKACYDVSRYPAMANDRLLKLSKKIKTLQNKYGELPIIEK